MSSSWDGGLLCAVSFDAYIWKKPLRSFAQRLFLNLFLVSWQKAVAWQEIISKQTLFAIKIRHLLQIWQSKFGQAAEIDIFLTKRVDIFLTK